MTFTVRWPDGATDVLYSPSLVVHDHLDDGGSYTVSDFAERSLAALAAASDRVRARFGSACPSAAATSEQIRRSAARYASDDVVEVLRLHPPLPAGTTGGGR